MCMQYEDDSLTGVGAYVGLGVGLGVGAFVGLGVGAFVGLGVGAFVGLGVGLCNIVDSQLLHGKLLI
jgi:hypothetical protein